MNERIVRPTQRAKPTKLAGSKNGRILVLPVAQIWVELQIPDDATNGVVKNTKNTDIQMRFEGDPESNYWPLAPGESTPEVIAFPIGGKLLFKGITPNGEIRAIFW